MSLKVIEISAIRKHGCGFLFAFYSNYGRICNGNENIANAPSTVDRRRIT